MCNSVSADKDDGLDAAKARVRALERRMRLGCGVVMMMADAGAARRQQERRLREGKGNRSATQRSGEGPLSIDRLHDRPQLVARGRIRRS